MKKIIYIIIVFFASIANILACTRAVYIGENDLVITGRTMDWKSDQETNIWAFPRGIKRDGKAGENSISWISKYGSIATSAYDIATVDGMNEKGLSANILYLTESEYIKPLKNDKRKTLAISMWVQYFLDNYATVNEAVKDMKKNRFYVVTTEIPNDGRQAGLHLSISDSTGDSAIFEYIDGELKIYHNKKYQVLTNSPEYWKQIAIQKYWENINGTEFLPGTNRAVDRFARASFYINAIPKTSDEKLGVASVLSVMRNVSVPIGITTPNEPNISTTRWRTIADQKNKVYFYDSVFNENIFWIELKNIDFSKDQPIKKLTLTDNEYFTKNVANKFKAVEKDLQFLPSE